MCEFVVGRMPLQHTVWLPFQHSKQLRRNKEKSLYNGLVAEVSMRTRFPTWKTHIHRIGKQTLCLGRTMF